MKIYKCRICDIYTLDKLCPRCGKETVGAHYKFIKVRKNPEDSKPKSSD